MLGQVQDLSEVVAQQGAGEGMTVDQHHIPLAAVGKLKSGSDLCIGNVLKEGHEDGHIVLIPIVLKVFQDFKQFFSMEIDESKYDDILNEFMSGKLLFMSADTNVIGKLEAARKNEENPFEYEYGITSIGMLNDTLRSQGLSVTKLVSVNGMSKHKQEAEDFAKFLTVDYSSNLYARTGKMACNYQKEYQYPQMEEIVRTYENSVSLPKIVETSNYWVLAEMVYTKAWDGEDVNKLLRQLSGQLKKQIHGVYVEDGYIETPVVNEDYVFQE